eukprot:s1698_g3.t2
MIRWSFHCLLAAGAICVGLCAEDTECSTTANVLKIAVRKDTVFQKRLVLWSSEIGFIFQSARTGALPSAGRLVMVERHGLLKDVEASEERAVSSPSWTMRASRYVAGSAALMTLLAFGILGLRTQSSPKPASQVLRMLHAAPVISLMELMPEGYENCFKNLTYFVEVDGFFTLPHAQESRFSSALECQQQCAKTYRCEHFSFWSSGGCLLTSYSSYPRKYDGPDSGSVVSGPRMCQAPPAPYRKKLPPGANVPPFVAKEAQGCGGLHAEYELAWKAEGETFFDDWQFIEKSMTRGAEWYLNRSEAIYQSVAHASPAGAIIRVGEQVHPFKRRSLMLHSPQAWRPDVGFVVAMKYKHVPYGPGVWPAFWFLNSDRPWPSGGELDVLEFANDETAKVTFHTDQNCSLNVPKMLECSAQMTGVDTDMITSCLTNYSGNALGCMPPQVRRDGEWHPGTESVTDAVHDAWSDFLCAPRSCRTSGRAQFLSFEGRDDEPPEPDQGGGGTDVAKPFSVKWSAEWKTMHDIHQLQKVAGPMTKLGWLFAGVAVGVGISYSPAMLMQYVRGKKKKGEEEEVPADAAAAPADAAAPAAPAAKAAAAPAASAEEAAAILGVEANASPAEIRAGYRRKALEDCSLRAAHRSLPPPRPRPAAGPEAPDGASDGACRGGARSGQAPQAGDAQGEDRAEEDQQRRGENNWQAQSRKPIMSATEAFATGTTREGSETARKRLGDLGSNFAMLERLSGRYETPGWLMERRHIFTHRLSQEQRLELESFMQLLRDRDGNGQDAHAGPEQSQLIPQTLPEPPSTPSPPECARLRDQVPDASSAVSSPLVAPLRRRRRVEPAAPCPPVQSPGALRTRRITGGIHKVRFDTFRKRTEQSLFYCATVAVEGLRIKAVCVRTLEEAIDIHLLIVAIAECVRRNCSSHIKDKILQSIHEVSVEHAVCEQDLSRKLRFYFVLETRLWIGVPLMTPCYRVRNLDEFDDVVLRFQAARGNDKIFTGAGRHGILTALPHRDVEERWCQIRDVFLDVKEGRGQDRKDWMIKLDQMYQNRAPVRDELWRRFNETKMRRCESEQRRYEKWMKQMEARQERKRCATLEKRRRQMERNLQRKRRRQQKAEAATLRRRYERPRMKAEDRWCQCYWRSVSQKRKKLERLLQLWSRAHQKAQASAERKRKARAERQEKERWGCREYSNNPGVLVTVWDASGITTFHIPEGQIPADLKADKPQPNTWPAIWRMAFMPFDPKTCVDIAHPQEIVLNIALCGDWAGNAWYSCKECKNTGFIPNYCIPGHDCCTIYMSNPSAEEPLKTKAYFDIDYVKVFEPKGVKMPKYAAGTYRNGGVGVGDR